jgi:hypothetical protein
MIINADKGIMLEGVKMYNTGISCLHAEETANFLNSLGANVRAVNGKIYARPEDAAEACWIAEDYEYTVFPVIWEI